MSKFNLITRLNIKVICLVSVLLILGTVYSQWISLQERKKEYTEQMEIIIDFLVTKMPTGSFAEIAARQGVNAEKSSQEQVIAINKELQPILDNILITRDCMKFGIYSRQHKGIVAVGPDFDRSLLIEDNSAMHETDMMRYGETKNCIMWQGAPVIYHVRPISYSGIVIGHVFACVNLKHIYAESLENTINMFLGGIMVMLITFIIFKDIFIRLKRDLKLFAEQIVHGDAMHFESELPELTPIFQYIKKQTEKMSRLEKMNTIGEMAAGIGHEVRNPMTTVRGFLQYLSGKEQFKNQEEHFVLMIEELDRANSIITEFLSLAKNKNMDFRENNLNKVINEISPLLQADALRNNCYLEINLEDISTIVMDKDSIRQLVLNIERNAIEAMPQGGTITISTVNCGQKVLLAIKDQGIGIPDDFLDKLGIPFVTTKENGTGLGLAICYRIVQRHGAIISVESEPGKGTAFNIEFNKV